MNVIEKIFGSDRRVVVYAKSDTVMSKTICKKRDVARCISDVMQISNGRLNVTIEPYNTN